MLLGEKKRVERRGKIKKKRGKEKGGRGRRRHRHHSSAAAAAVVPKEPDWTTEIESKGEREGGERSVGIERERKKESETDLCAKITDGVSEQRGKKSGRSV